MKNNKQKPNNNYLVKVAIIYKPWTEYHYIHHKFVAKGIRVQVPFGKKNLLGLVTDCYKLTKKSTANLKLNFNTENKNKNTQTQNFSSMLFNLNIATNKSQLSDNFNFNSNSNSNTKSLNSFDQTNTQSLTSYKPITKIIDQTPIFSKNILKLANFLSSYYFHPIGEVFKTMLPSILTQSSQKWFLVLDSKKMDKSSVDPQLKQIIKKIFKYRKSLKTQTFKANIKKICQENNLCFKKISKLLDKLIKSESFLFLELYDNDNNHLKKHPLQKKHKIQSKLLELNNSQKQVFNSINYELEKGFNKPILLHGITGSGKTQIYIHLTNKLLSDNIQNQILILVPEIALAPQITQVFKKHFGNIVCVYHSGINTSQKKTTLNNLKNSTKRVLIGARSAVFTNFKKLALIIIDEEHDNSYKQQSGFLYHARDSAIMRAKFENCTILLGSATPSLESYHNAKTDKYLYLSITHRAINSTLPESIIIPSKPLSTKGRILKNTSDLYAKDLQESHISKQIITALKDNYLKKHQSMVIIHRRGYYHRLIHFKTGKSVSCDRCNVSYYLHLAKKILLCHYCDKKVDLNEFLKNNAHEEYFAMGCGSEKAYDFIKQSISYANVARIDSDMPDKKNSLAKIIQDFRDKKIDILVGTQMIAKGHDFSNVTLVALIEIDDILRIADFRASEKTFQLLVQAAGRSGRAELKGKVLIQTSRKHNLIIKHGINNDYDNFAQNELNYRNQYNYPPFSKIILFRFQHEKPDLLEKFCKDLVTYCLIDLENKFPVRILGPAIPGMYLLAGMTRRHLILISRSINDLHKLTRLIIKYITSYQTDKPQFKIDVDPTSLI